MGEDNRKKTTFKPGQVVQPRRGGHPILLLRRFHATWPTWESTGKWWQWECFNLESGKLIINLENAIEAYVTL